jgi:hypothetical protein
MPQRSPVIFWLLVAATLAVDAVVVSWAYAGSLDRVEALYFGLVCGQISIVGIWACFSTAPRWWQWLTSPVAAFIAALLTVLLYERGQTYGMDDAFELGMVYFSLWTVQLLLVIGGVWFLRHTSLGERWGHCAPIGRWQFSLKHLLAIMTFTPIALVAVKETRSIGDVWLPLVLWTLNNAILAVAAAIVHMARFHPVVRLASLAALAIAFGLFLEGINLGPESMAINLIQASVVFLWLEFGQLIPQRTIAEESIAANGPARP